MSPGDLKETIEFLNLNCPRLWRARRDLFEDLDAQLANHLDQSKGMEKVIRAELLRAAGEPHEPFFSTRRSYFHHYGHAEATEAVLDEPPRAWI